MKKICVLILLAAVNSTAIAEGQNEGLVKPSTDEAVCAKQIQPIIDLWKKNERTLDDAKHLAAIQKAKGSCAAQNEYRKSLGFN